MDYSCDGGIDIYGVNSKGNNIEINVNEAHLVETKKEVSLYTKVDGELKWITSNKMYRLIVTPSDDSSSCAAPFILKWYKYDEIDISRDLQSTIWNTMVEAELEPFYAKSVKSLSDEEFEKAKKDGLEVFDAVL